MNKMCEDERGGDNYIIMMQGDIWGEMLKIYGDRKGRGGQDARE